MVSEAANSPTPPTFCAHCGVDPQPRTCTSATFAACPDFTHTTPDIPNFTILLQKEPRIDRFVICEYAAAYPSRIPTLMKYLIRSIVPDPAQPPITNVDLASAVDAVRAATEIAMHHKPNGDIALRVQAGDQETAKLLMSVIKPEVEKSLQETAARILQDARDTFAKTQAALGEQRNRSTDFTHLEERVLNQQRSEALVALNTDTFKVGKLWFDMIMNTEPTPHNVAIVQNAIQYNINRARELGLDTRQQMKLIVAEVNGHRERQENAPRLEMLKIAKRALEAIASGFAFPENELCRLTICAIETEISRCPLPSDQTTPGGSPDQQDPPSTKNPA